MPGKKSHGAVDVSSPALGWIAAILSILLSLLLIPLAGIQDDEALFAVPFWQSLGRQFEIRVFHHSLPLMLISYLGTLKTALYWILFKLLPGNVWMVRLPVVFAGALTVYLFYSLTRRISKPGAVCAGFLLATDPTFLLTNTFDWGPVALEHLLLVGGCYALMAFAETKRPGLLGLGFLLFGLALWNKALFLWAFSGIIAGALAAFPHRLRAAMNGRNLKIAAAGLLLGSLPFVIYNLRRHGATVGENVHLDTESLSRKWLQVENAANGNSLFAFLAEEDYVEPPKPVVSLVARASGWIHDLAGKHRITGFYYVFGAVLVLVPLWWRSRAAWFSLIFLLVAGAMMLLTKDAGGAAHHIVLLWPFPILFVSVGLAAIPWRWLGVSIMTGLVGMNLLVVNQYLYQLERNGAATNFTDALLVLSKSLPEYDDRHIYVIDWGITNSVQLSNHGQLPLRFASDPLMTDTPNEIQRTQLETMLSDPVGIIVDHVKAREAFIGVGERLERYADAAGYRREILKRVADSNGRPVFEIFQFRR